jgi:adenylate cyclase
MDWTAIGDTVNTASRIEQHSKPGQVLISEDTYERIRDYVETSERFLIRVKGKRQELPVYFVESVEYDSGAGAPLKLRRLPG